MQDNGSVMFSDWHGSMGNEEDATLGKYWHRIGDARI